MRATRAVMVLLAVAVALICVLWLSARAASGPGVGAVFSGP